MGTKEITYEGTAINGFAALLINLIALPLLAAVSANIGMSSGASILLTTIFAASFFLMLPGYFSQEPNEGRVMVFFGKYKGTFTKTGFF